MRWQEPVFGVILTLALSAAASEVPDISVSEAWIREPPPGAAMTGGYMALRNNTPRTRLLVAASSSDFGTVMIHRTIVKSGVARMEHATQIALTPHANLIFAPGGYHLMLTNPKRALRAGDRVRVALEFSGGLVLPVTFEIRK